MKITKLNHLGFVLETDQARVWVDPMLKSDLLFGAFFEGVDKTAWADELPSAIVLTSHREGQFHLPSLALVGRETPVFYPEANGFISAHIRRLGFKNLTRMRPGREYRVSDLSVEPKPGPTSMILSCVFSTAEEAVMYVGCHPFGEGTKTRAIDTLLMDFSFLGAGRSIEHFGNDGIFDRELSRFTKVIELVRPKKIAPLMPELRNKFRTQDRPAFYGRIERALRNLRKCEIVSFDRAPGGWAEAGSDESSALDPLLPEDVQEAKRDIRDFMSGEFLPTLRLGSGWREILRKHAVGWRLKVEFVELNDEDALSFDIDFSKSNLRFVEKLEQVHVISTVSAAAFIRVLRGEINIAALVPAGLLDWRVQNLSPQAERDILLHGEPLSIYAAALLASPRAQKILSALGIEYDPLSDRGNGWLPSAFRPSSKGVVVDLVKREEQDFKSLFFFEALQRSLPQSIRKTTSIRDFSALPIARKGVEPRVFVYHCSRCGSTLVSQMLAQLPELLVLAEPTALESIFDLPGFTIAQKTAYAVQAINALGNSMRGSERGLAIKFAGSTNWLPWLQEVYPDTPWIFIYREPGHVLTSNLLRPPLWLSRYDSDHDREIALAKKYEWQLSAAIQAADRAALLVDYADIKPEFTETLLRALKLPVSDERIALMQKSFSVYSKRTSTPWKSKAESYEKEKVDLDPAVLEGLRRKYDELNREKLRFGSSLPLKIDRRLEYPNGIIR